MCVCTSGMCEEKGLHQGLTAGTPQLGWTFGQLGAKEGDDPFHSRSCLVRLKT